MFPEDVRIELRGKKMPYVSRGGFKLERALAVFPIGGGPGSGSAGSGQEEECPVQETDGEVLTGEKKSAQLDGLTCMDVGSSTGGFTDCMLQNGVGKVYAIDVGTNQLAWKLRQDSRVVVMEKTNIRHVQPEDIGEKVDFVSIDVAFISLSLVFGPVRALMKEEARMVALIKPQFEAGREQVGKKGVVRDPAVHEEVIRKVMGYAVDAGFTILGLDHSPIRGPEGNIEYLLYLGCGEGDVGEWETAIVQVVETAHETLQ